jgi:rRNA maturation endonuclease Nob1
MKDWTTCNNCEEEYQVIGGCIDADPGFCPFCGEELEIVDEDEELEDDE